ncbi:hypothetical protein C1H46_029435 [Malus baccata]|uniref:Uncharacterized protein n=1 Tax=Malus baccata TaxID=106549 RepID=A0A540LEW4_MALBA|nr:hypothetical protein C1H46_029435 [Malus baccata]
MAASPSLLDLQLQLQSEFKSPMSPIVYVISQQVQGAMENMFKMMSKINENSARISEEIEKYKESALERRKA